MIIFRAFISIATEAVSFTRPPILPSVGGACVDTEGTRYTKLYRLLLRMTSLNFLCAQKMRFFYPLYFLAGKLSTCRPCM